MVYLKLHNFVPLLEANRGELDIDLPVGTNLIIAEPSYYTDPNGTGLPYILVESPSDVTYYDPDDPMVTVVTWKREAKKVVRPLPTTGEGWKAEGLKEFKASRCFVSAHCFWKCIQLEFEVEVSRLNRAEIYHRLGWNNSALHDAQAVLDSGTLSDDLKRKAVNRKLKALYALGRYQEVLQTASVFEGDEVMVEWATRAKQRIEEQGTGNYEWLKLYKSAEKGLFSPDIADYTGPVEVKSEADGYRGTYVTRDVKAGELLVSFLRLGPK